MNRNRTGIALSVLAVCFLASTSLVAVAGAQEVEVKGFITTRTGETLVLKTSSGPATVVLTDDTKVQQPTGVGIRKKNMSAAVLMPGLKVNVKGVADDQKRVVAKSITFSGDDLRTAEMIQAGLNPTAEQVAANQQNINANKQNIAANKGAIDENAREIEETQKRFNSLTEFDVKAEQTVRFAVGSTKISAKDKEGVMKLAREAVNLTGYIIQVKGFADSTGNAAVNQKLSMERAQAVIAYLLQNCNIPVRHVVAPGAMGIADPVASNETSSGRAENRRVEVKLLVNRGLAGK
jgi:outer membrane protein OmpA-like peptidoglycan-associated protein